MANEDQISEVYKGLIWGGRSQKRTRERIDWLVSQARGEVLDVGCSQGIASILCARRGLNVLGVDNEADRIAYALAERDRKPAEVRERLEFRVGDASRLGVPDDAFDSVLLGEVLEHLADPAPVLAEVARVCKPDGVIALTTPFGYSPHHDHKATFFPASLVAALAPQLTITSLDIHDDYFRVIARPGGMTEQQASELVLAVQPLLEQRVLEIHREMLQEHAEALRLAERTKRLRKKVRAHKERERSRGLRRRASRLIRSVRRRRDREQRLSPAERKRRRLAKRKWTMPAEIASEAACRVAIPDVELPEGPVARPDLKVAAILDHFTATALRYEWDQVQFGPEEWREVLEREEPQLLFVESAWRANGDRWRREIVGDLEGRRGTLLEVINWCRDRGVPTVFWSKEDPPNFHRFIDTAGLFDWVFTVDGDLVPRYQEVLDHERVAVLPFGVQPRIHNPIGVPGGRSHDIAFAGTYYATKHPARRAQMEVILAPALRFGLDIFSRVTGDEPDFAWPAEYREHVVGSLPYERILAAYKAYKVFLNVNSVTDSRTMCARRVFELTACSTPILSGYSRAIGEVFGDLVPVSTSADETTTKLAAMLSDPETTTARAHEAMRRALAAHTYGHRVNQVLRSVGLPVSDGPPTVSAIAVLEDDDEGARRLIDTIAAQSWSPLELVLVGSGGDVETATRWAHETGIERVVVRHAPVGAQRGGCLNLAVDAAGGELVAPFDPACGYEEHYLTDLVHAFSYTDAGIVGKRAHYSRIEPGGPALCFSDSEHRYVDRVEPGSMMVAVEVVRRHRFGDGSPDPEPDLVARCRERGVRVYSNDRFSFVRERAGGRAATALR
jgi:SAM-dependent methyltransferase/spore maturation protein CgeB